MLILEIELGVILGYVLIRLLPDLLALAGCLLMITLVVGVGVFAVWSGKAWLLPWAKRNDVGILQILIVAGTTIVAADALRARQSREARFVRTEASQRTRL